MPAPRPPAHLEDTLRRSEDQTLAPGCAPGDAIGARAQRHTSDERAGRSGRRRGLPWIVLMVLAGPIRGG